MLKNWKKVKILIMFGSKKTGKCQQLETNNIVSWYWHLPVFFAFFFHKHFTFFTKKCGKIEKRENFCNIWFKKNWQVSAARYKQDCFLLLTLASFFEIFFINTPLFSLKNTEKLKKVKNAKCLSIELFGYMFYPSVQNFSQKCWKM